mgnify:FL=1
MLPPFCRQSQLEKCGQFPPSAPERIAPDFSLLAPPAASSLQAKQLQSFPPLNSLLVGMVIGNDSLFLPYSLSGADLEQ